ncbi:Signal transduction response regulator, antiterminator [Syntrophomonas zehnderi OL-4]|uniref:Stage 0 sporulation protein A homolog n=1 Tax=Syntrophomonas zehnderi OL-4 TaxID=690567 RepID=A0A0E3W373_9FIRM|nr:ANTAR domain-containing protein [Syntrophomonas zehnderi]CFX56114.1 Signal transduction response regulator, antiterminator [Syntrophomonas zehnderi OL-4]
MGGKIIIASASVPEKKFLNDSLVRAGHHVIAESNNMSHAFRRTRSLDCDLVIVDNNLDGGKGLKTASIISEDHLAAVLLLVDGEMFPATKSFHYLIRPIYYNTLIPAVEAALWHWQRELAMQEQIRTLEEKLKTRKLLDRAKGILIDKLKLSENEAHHFIQREAMNSGSTLRQIATEIINQEQKIKPIDSN